VTTALFLVWFVSFSLLAFFRHAIFGLLLYVGVYFLSPQARWWGDNLPTNSWSLISSIVLLGAVLVRRPAPQNLPLLSHKFVWGLIAYVVWLGIQTLWALDREVHVELLVLFTKYLVLIALMYACIDSERHLRWFFWVNVVGGAYVGWMVYTTYAGGRFEGTGVPGAKDTNSAALLFATVTLASAALFLGGRLGTRVGLLGIIPFIVNALVATVSRSGFLALGVGGVLFNLFTPTRYRRLVRLLSVLALLLFVLLTNPLYWSRIETIKYAGEEVQGIDTAHARLVTIQAQWKMFRLYPLGCGHRCTAVLSPQYLDDKYLTGTGPIRQRASHNVFMTMLVEQGIPGAIFYILLLFWGLKQVFLLARRLAGQEGFLAQVFPATVGILGAITVGDLFVDFLKFETRLWYITVLMLLLSMSSEHTKAPAIPEGPDPVVER
jgi:O-Antigen ligase